MCVFFGLCICWVKLLLMLALLYFLPILNSCTFHWLHQWLYFRDKILVLKYSKYTLIWLFKLLLHPMWLFNVNFIYMSSFNIWIDIILYCILKTFPSCLYIGRNVVLNIYKLNKSGYSSICACLIFCVPLSIFEFVSQKALVLIFIGKL